MVLGGLQSQRLGCCVPGKLLGWWIDLLGGRSDNLCECLCCMVVVASDLRACGAFVWLTVSCSVGWITICKFNAIMSRIWVRGVCASMVLSMFDVLAENFVHCSSFRSNAPQRHIYRSNLTLLLFSLVWLQAGFLQASAQMPPEAYITM